MEARLRRWRPEDAAALWDALRTSPDLETQFGEATPRSDVDSAVFLAAHLGVSDRAEHWAIVVDGRPVGDVAVSAIEHRHDSGWVSYWLATGSRGLGLAGRALAALADRAFTELGLHRLELGHRVNNPASCAVARRAGFVAEGVEREKLRYGDERFDTETHARLATDPPPDVVPLPFEETRG